MEVTDIVIGLKLYYVGDRRAGDGDRHCYRIETVTHVIDVMAMVMEVTFFDIGLKLYYIL